MLGIGSRGEQSFHSGANSPALPYRRRLGRVYVGHCHFGWLGRPGRNVAGILGRGIRRKRLRGHSSKFCFTGHIAGGGADAKDFYPVCGSVGTGARLDSLRNIGAMLCSSASGIRR